MTELVTFAADLIAQQTGLVEPDGDRLVAILPPSLAETLGLEETVTLAASPGDGDVSIAYGSRALERMVQLATARPPLSAVRLVKIPTVSVSAVEKAAAAFELRNAIFSITSIRPIRAERLIVHALVMLDGDERRQMLVTTVLSRKTLSPLLGFEYLSPYQLESDEASAPLPEDEASALLSAAEAASWGRAEAFVASVRERMHHRKTRDRDRIRRYFAELAEELDGRAQRHKLEADAVASKRVAIERDQQAKLDALEQRYMIKAELRPIAALRVNAPAWSVELDVKRRKSRRDITLEYDSFTRSLVPARCEGCGGPAARPAACDDAVHLLCERCVPEVSGRFVCPRCRKR